MRHNDHSVVLRYDTMYQCCPISAQDVAVSEKIRVKMKEYNMVSLRVSSTFLKNQAKLSSKSLKDMNLKPYEEGYTLRDGEIKIYANASGSIAGKSEMYVIDTDKLKNYTGTFQVCFRQSIIENPSRAWKVFLFDNRTVYGNTAVRLFQSNSEEEAINFWKYASSKFFEYCMMMTITGRMKALGACAPDLSDYTDNNPYIDFSQDIDKQLCDLFDIDYHMIVFRLDNREAHSGKVIF